jgi:hypothetical protein
MNADRKMLDLTRRQFDNFWRFPITQSFSPSFPLFLCVSRILGSRRRLPHGHHHQPCAIQHEEQNCGKEILAHWHVLKNAPHHPAHDEQIKGNVHEKDFDA